MASPKPPVQLNLNVERITPTVAKEMLEKNVFNRRISERLIQVYATSIRNDEWRLNGEPIIFDQKDVLQSGQHRLLAVIEANKPIWSVVVRGAQPEALFSLDSGRKRRLTDALILRGEKDVANLATAVTWLWRYQSGSMDRKSEVATTTHLLKVLDEYPSIRDSMTVGRQARSGLRLSIGLVAALHWAFSGIDEEDCDHFFELLIGGANLPANHPVLTLTKWIRRAQIDPQRRPSSTHYAAVIIKAWNAYREHRDLRILTYRGSEAFPEPV